MTIHDDIFNVLSEVFPKGKKQIIDESGHAYQTVSEYLDRMKAEKVVVSGQTKFLRPSTDPHRLTISLGTSQEPVRHWRVIRDSTAEDIRQLRISQDADPIWLADRFIEYGKLLMEIGLSLEAVKLDPDWYAKLGGRIWLSNH